MTNSVQQCITAIQQGEFAIVIDHQDREDEADLVIAAEKITVPQMAFLIRHSSGIICVPMEQQRLQELELSLLQSDTPAKFNTPFTMPVDYLPTSRGGVSAQERVDTVHALIDPKASAKDFGRPGHVFPLEVDQNGLASRLGHTEASIELIERAGLYPAAVIGELLNTDGSMMRGERVSAFARRHSIPYCTIAEISEK